MPNAVGVWFGAKPAQSETAMRAAAKRRPPEEDEVRKDGVAFRLGWLGWEALISVSRSDRAEYCHADEHAQSTVAKKINRAVTRLQHSEVRVCKGSPAP